MILTAQYPFGSESTHTPHQLITNIKLRKLQTSSNVSSNLSKDAIDLLNKLFHLDPNERITARDILKHPWIADKAKLPEIDLGQVYKNRLKTWSYRKRLCNLLNRSSFGSVARQHALQTILSEGSCSVNQHIVNDVYSNYMVRSSSSDDYGITFNHSSSIVPKIETQQHICVNKNNIKYNDCGFTITNKGINDLKNAFVCYIMENQSTTQSYPSASTMTDDNKECHNHQQKPFNNSIFTIEQALQHKGIDYAAFHAMMQKANFASLSSTEVFELFDWNHSGKVDYLEFLFTLSSFRKDVDWTNAQSVSRLYYDIFDLQLTECNTNGSSGSGRNNKNNKTISVDMLGMVLNKLLIESNYQQRALTITDCEQNHINIVKSHSLLGSQRSKSRENGNLISRYIDESHIHTSNKDDDVNQTTSTGLLNSSVANMSLNTATGNKEITKELIEKSSVTILNDDDPEQLSSSNIFDIVQSIDTDGDGKITYHEFEAFFNVILRLKSISKSISIPHSSQQI